MTGLGRAGTLVVFAALSPGTRAGPGNSDSVTIYRDLEPAHVEPTK